MRGVPEPKPTPPRAHSPAESGPLASLPPDKEATTGPLPTTASVRDVGARDGGRTGVGPGTRWSLKELATRAVRDDQAPTWGLDLRAINDGIEASRARAVIDLAMRIGESVLSTGASAADVTATMLQLTRAYGLASVHVDVTFTAVFVTHHRGERDPVSLMRTVRTRSADYERLARLQRLVNEIAETTPAPLTARRRFETIVATPHLYRRGVVTVSSAVLGAGVAALLGGGVREVLLALLAAAAVDRAQLWAARRRLPAFFGQVIGGAIPTTVAVAVYAAPSVPLVVGVRPGLIVASGIVALLSGLSVVGAAQDAIDGFYITAGARTFEVLVLTLGIVVGIIAVLGVGQRLGVPYDLVPTSTLARHPVVQAAACATIASAFAVGAYSGLRTVAAASVLGVLGWAVHGTVLQSHLGAAAACAAAGLAVGFASQVIGGRLAVSSLALSTAGIVALLPGSVVYRGLYYLVSDAVPAQALSRSLMTLVDAGSIGLALAAGVSLGTYAGRPFRRDGEGSHRARERVLRRATTHGRE